MRVATTIPADGCPAPSEAIRSALSAIISGSTISCQRAERAERHDLIRAYLIHRHMLDAIIPGLSDLDPGPASDLLREFRRDPLRQLRVPHAHLQAAICAARILCWLKLHRPWLFGGL